MRIGQVDGARFSVQCDSYAVTPKVWYLGSDQLDRFELLPRPRDSAATALE